MLTKNQAKTAHQTTDAERFKNNQLGVQHLAPYGIDFAIVKKAGGRLAENHKVCAKCTSRIKNNENTMVLWVDSKQFIDPLITVTSDILVVCHNCINKEPDINKFVFLLDIKYLERERKHNANF